MKSELISELDAMYDVISDEDGVILVESNRKFDFCFKVEIENICKQYSEKMGVELDPIYDINDRKYFYATIDTNPAFINEDVEVLMETLKETVESWASEYYIGFSDDYKLIFIEVPPLREDPYALTCLKSNLNKLDAFNGGKNLGAELDGPCNDFVLYPNTDVLEIDTNKNYSICDGDYIYW